MPSNKYTPELAAKVQEAVNYTTLFSLAEAARQLNHPRETVANWLVIAKRKGVTVDMDAVREIFSRHRLGLDDKVRELESQLTSRRRDELTAENVRTAIIGLDEKSPAPPKWLARETGAGKAGVPVTMWSDWHWGEVVDPDQINGVNEFDITIAQRRARTLVERTTRLCKKNMVGAEYPGLVLCLGGDMVSGDIHDELTETSELPTMPALIDLFGVMIWGIAQMADAFGRVFVPCVVGNHGRTTVKPRMKGKVYSNFDWLLYTFLEKHFASDDRVQFFIPTGADANFTVAGRRFLLTHGDTLGTAGGDGIIGCLGPILRGDFKARNSNQAVGLPYDTLLIGHYHQYMPLDRVIVNGSLKGYDEFTKLKMRAQPEIPRQALFFVHPDHGITCHWPVNVDERGAAAKDGEWVKWRA